MPTSVQFTSGPSYTMRTVASPSSGGFAIRSVTCRLRVWISTSRRWLTGSKSVNPATIRGSTRM